MMISLPRIFATLVAATIGLPALATAQSQPVRDGNVEAQLISSHTTIAPGQTFKLGLKLTIDPTWHTYWINPGETGKPTELKLTLPAGFEAGPLQFPVPKRFITDYGFNILEAGFGYETLVVHPIEITAPASLKPGESVTIAAKADWLMCDPGTCVPGKAELSINLAAGETASPSPEASSIEFYSKKTPKEVDWPFELSLQGENLVATTTFPEGTIPAEAKLKFFPYQVKVLDQLAETEVTQEGYQITFSTKKHDKLTEAPAGLSALIIADTGTTKTGYKVSAAGAKSLSETGPETKPTSETEALTESDNQPEALPFGGGLFGILLAAFLGGMILNIMPCVFPVISLKVLSFVGQAGEDRKKVFAHSSVFALGVLVFFWLLTAALLIVRATAGDVGWGAQLQQPAFVIGLIFVMVLVAMSLFGVFEIGTAMTGIGGDLANKSGYAGSFWSGALAVLLATPCTAPLMAPAIAFALAQPAPITIIVFSCLGLGMAAPYFLFAVFPKLLDMLPAPGPWMETFKQFMGFPMLAVVVWLTGVLSKQLNVSGLQWSLAAVLLLATAGWILGRFASLERPAPVRMKGRIAALIVFVISIGLAYQSSAKRADPPAIDIADVISKHRSEGKHVFVDFTAEWCVTCKVNERTTIKTDAVQQTFKDNNIEFVIADWTNEDPAITRLLKEHGRAGVPFYVLYPSDESAAAIPLGDGLITPGDIDEAISQLPN
ncbi:MAG: thioredoxin family protein [Verrucomicrobiota bacterium]